MRNWEILGAFGLCLIARENRVERKWRERKWEERKEERNCFLSLYLIEEKSEKKENRRENIFLLFGWIEKWRERKVNKLK